MKTSDLIGPALDWAVAKCEGLSPHVEPHIDGTHIVISSQEPRGYFPSTNWSHSGPIIEREKIEFRYHDVVVATIWYRYGIGRDERLYKATAPTPLIAAMRCYVASKLGDNINIPKELE